MYQPLKTCTRLLNIIPSWCHSNLHANNKCTVFIEYSKNHFVNTHNCRKTSTYKIEKWKWHVNGLTQKVSFIIQFCNPGQMCLVSGAKDFSENI